MTRPRCLPRARMMCRAEVQTLRPLAPSDSYGIFSVEPGTQFTMSGWAWMDHANAPAGLVIAVDTHEHIVGIAMTTQIGSRAEDWLGQKFRGNVGWFGFARIIDPQGVKFYALTRDGLTYCRLGLLGDAR